MDQNELKKIRNPEQNKTPKESPETEEDFNSVSIPKRGMIMPEEFNTVSNPNSGNETQLSNTFHLGYF